MLNHLLLNKWPAAFALAMLLFAVRRIVTDAPKRRDPDAATQRRARRAVAWDLFIVVAGLALGANSAGLIKLPGNAAPGHLTYAIPPGWTDLSPGTPLREQGQLPEEIKQVLSVDARAVAVDWRPGEAPTPNATMMATHHVGGPVTVRLMLETWDEMAGASRVPLDREPEMLSWGCGCGRLIARVPTPHGDVGMVVYFVPNGERSFAILSFTTGFAALDEYRDVFESAARKTASSSSS